MGIDRSETIARMRIAFKSGLSQSQFFKQEKETGRPTYRRTTMLADWRSEFNIKEKEGLMRYVRRDRFPSKKAMAVVSYEMSKEFMYKVRTRSIIKAGEPMVEKFINIMTDNPMTVEMLESEIRNRWGELQESVPGELMELQVWSAVRRTIE